MCHELSLHTLYIHQQISPKWASKWQAFLVKGKHTWLNFTLLLRSGQQKFTLNALALCFFFKGYKREPLQDQGKQLQSKKSKWKIWKNDKLKTRPVKNKEGGEKYSWREEKSKYMSYHISDIFSVATGKWRLFIDFMWKQITINFNQYFCK